MKKAIFGSLALVLGIGLMSFNAINLDFEKEFNLYREQLKTIIS